MRGRKPKPTAIKRAAGNPGRRPLNDLEPMYGVIMLRMPRNLGKDKIAAREWRRVVPQLVEAGVVTPVDRVMLEVYCNAYAQYVKAMEIVRERGQVVKTQNGNLIQNPYLSVANRAGETLRQCSIEYGMTPSSRSRIKVDVDHERSLAEILFEGIEESGEVEEGEGK